MTNAAHTPGAWRITDDFIGVHDQQGRCIADMDSEGAPDIGYDESLANAHLIAAAPDMLAALEALLEGTCEAMSFLDTHLVEHLKPLADAAERAIAKAKGE